MTTYTKNLYFGEIWVCLMDGLVRDYKPKEIYFCLVDNWFDSKWLNFSGKTLGALGIWNSEEVTIPPFNPNRIVGEMLLDRQNDATDYSCTYKLRKDHKTIHPRQSSGENLNRKIRNFTTDALFVWVNKNAKENNFGSIMVYIIKEKELMTFYASLEDKSNQIGGHNWNFQKVLGINSKQIMQFVDRGESYDLRLDVD